MKEKIIRSENRTAKTGIRKKYDLSHWQLSSMIFPGVLMVLVFNYLPMFGLVLAFKDFKYNLGIFGSDWVGLNNFKFLLEVKTLWILIRNTIGYNVIFIALGVIIPVIMALCMYRIKSSLGIKMLQNAFLLPRFVSWIIVSYICYSFLAVDNGIINIFLSKFGIQKISFYSEPKYWPYILTLFNTWKVIGFNTLVYYGSILDIDTSLLEAAALDGCNEMKKIKYVILPHLTETIVILVILAIGKIFRADSGLFYYLPKDSGALYSVTDVLDTYVLRSLKNSGDIGTTSAVTFIQSVVGFVMVVVTNWIVKRINSENALF